MAGSLDPISALSKLQTLNAGGNVLGKKISVYTHHHKHLPHHKQQQQKPPEQKQPPPLPNTLPTSLKTLKLSSNFLPTIPKPSIFTLVKLEKLDLSNNQIAAIPPEIQNLASLNELNLDNNLITALPEEMGKLKKLKSLSLRQNHIRVLHPNQKFNSSTNPQPIPASLFTNTLLIDLNLHNNPMTSTQLNEFDGYSTFLERRAATNTKNLYGGAMANLSVTGLE